MGWFAGVSGILSLLGLNHGCVVFWLVCDFGVLGFGCVSLLVERVRVRGS